jgi:hypothetical protein
MHESGVNLAQILSPRRPSQALMRRSLPVFAPQAAPDALDLVEIPIPCDVPWDGMSGDDQVRHCSQCKQNVYNVSALTRPEAMQLLRSRACLRIFRRPDNTVVTSDCRERLRAARKRGLWVFAGALLIVLWAQICAQFVGLTGLKKLLAGRHTMGAPAPITTPVPGQLVPQPPPTIIGPPPMLPEMGLPPLPARPRHHHTMGARGARGKPAKTQRPQVIDDPLMLL